VVVEFIEVLEKDFGGYQIGVSYGDDKMIFGLEGCFLWVRWFLEVFWVSSE